MSETLVTVSNLNKTFLGSNSKALDDINFEVKEGEFFCLLGPDAAGKTTLLRIIASILKYDSGAVKILNKKIPQEISEIQHLIGYAPQKFGLYEDLTVLENLDLNADLRGIAGAEKDEQITKLLAKTNLKNFFYKSKLKPFFVKKTFAETLWLMIGKNHSRNFIFLKIILNNHFCRS